MNRKPHPRIGEPHARYAEIAGQPAAALLSLSAEQEAYLRESMEDFKELDADAKEAGLPPPAPNAKRAALAFLQQAVREVPRYYAVSLQNEGTVVVYTQDEQILRVSVYFRAEGGVSCYVLRPDNTENERRHFPQMDKTAAQWIFTALRGLKADDPAH